MIFYLFIFNLSVVLAPLSHQKMDSRKFFILYFPFFLLAICQWGHFVLFGTEISAGAVSSIMGSNVAEVYDWFLSLNPVMYLFLVLAFIGPVLVLRLEPVKFKYRKPVLILAFSLTLFLIIIRTVQFRSFSKALDETILKQPLIKSVSRITDGVKEYQNYIDLMNRASKFVPPFRTLKNKGARHIHFVYIGESSRRASWSLYEYERETNPLLGKRNDLIVYSDAISTSNNTILSLTDSFILDFGQKKSNIIGVESKAGYETLWASNQAKYGFYDTGVSITASAATRSIFINTDMNNYSLDGKIIPYLKKEIEESSDKDLIIYFHSMGSHTYYKRRYPKEFSKFSDEDNSLMAEYDNTVLYTDFLVNYFIEMIKEKDVIASFIYFSDHGELINDGPKGYVGHGTTEVWKKEVEIPFIVWLSEKFKKAYPEMSSAIEKNKSLPISLKSLPKSLLTIHGIDVGGKGFFGLDYTPPNERIISTPQGTTKKYRRTK